MAVRVSDTSGSRMTDFGIIFDAVPPRALVLEPPSDFTLNPGVEEIVTQRRSRLGLREVSRIIQDAEQPIISATFPGWTPEIFGLRLQREFQSVTNKSTTVYNTFVVSADVAAANNGEEGFGMPPDIATSIASRISSGGLSIPLTRQAFSTFDPTINDAFAQGANGELKFSDNIYINGGTEVTVALGPYTLTNPNAVAMTAKAFNKFRLGMEFINNSLQIVRIEFPLVNVKGDEGDINPAGDSAPITFRHASSGRCLPYEIIFTGDARAEC